MILRHAQRNSRQVLHRVLNTYGVTPERHANNSRQAWKWTAQGGYTAKAAMTQELSDCMGNIPHRKDLEHLAEKF